MPIGVKWNRPSSVPPAQVIVHWVTSFSMAVSEGTCTFNVTDSTSAQQAATALMQAYNAANKGSSASLENDVTVVFDPTALAMTFNSITVTVSAVAVGDSGLTVERIET